MFKLLSRWLFWRVNDEGGFHMVRDSSRRMVSLDRDSDESQEIELGCR
jgi:hypothetical protein